MHTYQSKSGLLTLNNGAILPCYSGNGDGRNNPFMEAVPNVGPIPHGDWLIGPPYDSVKTGPFTLPLYRAAAEPVPGSRSAFRIHGNNRTNDASHGCIIPEGGHAARVVIWAACQAAKDYALNVTVD